MEKTTYYAGETHDLDYVLRWLYRHNPDVPLFAVGYSLGGNMLLKLLGEKDSGISLAAAAAVSVPFELSECTSRLEKGLSRIYQRWLIGSMKKPLDGRLISTIRIWICLLYLKPELFANLTTWALHPCTVSEMLTTITPLTAAASTCHE